MINTLTYQQRRAELARRVGHGLVLLPGHSESPCNYRDNCYPFRQDSTLLYFSGLALPDITLLLDCDTGQATLLAADPHPDDIVWTGPVPSRAEQAARAGTEHHAPLSSLQALLDQAQTQGRTVHRLPVARTGDASTASATLLRAVVDMRAVKSADEVAQIEDALHTTRDMHLLALRQARVGVAEQAVVGAMEGLVAARGLRMAYPVIFSSRGEILHNHHHDQTLKDGDLIVNDSGAESPLGYASDITRTIPASGRFTPLQADLYRLVLKAQQEAIARLLPGVPYRAAHEHACTVLVDGMIGLGFMRGNAADAVARGAHAIVFPCGTGHMLGLDVHDMEGLGEQHVGYGEGHTRSPLPGHKYLRMAREVQPGFVLTVEPGIYFNPWQAAQWQAQGLHTDLIDYDAMHRHMAQFRSGGIRIEDDVLITEHGARVLGPHIARSLDEVEAACASAA
jgi:Xaa-Pro aminopeptidase